MKKLILLRHSFAESGSFSTPDFNRRLTPKGKSRANLHANKLLKKGLVPDLIITSTAIRAEETTEIISTVLNYRGPINRVSLLYEDFATLDFFKLLNNINSSMNTVLLIGHNPTISTMASRIDRDSLVSFRPCSIGIFEVNSKWNQLEVGSGRMVEYVE